MAGRWPLFVALAGALVVVGVGVTVVVTSADDEPPQRPPMAALCPGPTVDTLGQVDGHDVVQLIEATQEERTTAGALLFATVRVQENADTKGACTGSRHRVLVPRAELLASGTSAEPADWRASAEDAALTDLGFPPDNEAATVDQGSVDLGGPQAGLAIALAIMDKISPLDLTGGATVGAAGTVDAEGTVGPVSDIAQRVAAAHDAGATVFLVPADDCATARAAAPDLRLVAVTTLHEAARALTDVDSAPGC
jgi:PDZ domain-containing secreted protein